MDNSGMYGTVQPMGATEQYPRTVIDIKTGPQKIASALQEQEFQKTIKNSPWYSQFVQRFQEQPDLRAGGDYNYRLAVAKGVQPQPDPYDNNALHWPSSLPDGTMLKSEGHPTAWKEYYMRANNGINPDSVGATEADWKKSQGIR